MKQDDVKNGIKESLWRTVSKTVRPLEGRESLYSQHLEAFFKENEEEFSSSINKKPTKKPPVFVKPTKTPMPTSQKPTKPAMKLDLLGFLEHGDSPGVDKRTALRLKKGRMQVDARIDLHGHSVEAAHRRLNSFVLSSSKAGYRCVLVVTGKGDKGMGVIKQSVPNWLNDIPLRGKILSFTHAQPNDGGQGALYVLLKRTRDY